ncbi:MAG: hypothetical protein ACOY3Z_00770 [Thermodesulfobacteriota bacterium]
MQETWSSDPLVVEKEVDRLIAGSIQLVFYQKGQPPQRLLPAEIFPKNTYRLLLLKKDKAFFAPREEGLLLYRAPEGATRGFQATPLFETKENLGVLLPLSIFALQRRRHQRYATSNTNSHVTFARHGSQYLNHGLVEDICIEGARLVGRFSEHIRPGEVLAPLSMTLRLRFGAYEEKITAAEAVVRRVAEGHRDNRELGIQFLLHDQDAHRLEGYLSIRAAEDTAPRPIRY